MIHKKRRYRSRPYRRRKKSPETVFWIALLTILIVVGSGFAVHTILFGAWSTAHSGQNMPLSATVEITEETKVREWTPKTPDTHHSILLLGLDNHGMCDVIMIVSYDLFTFDTSLISIKRDTFVPNQNWAAAGLGQDHIAWANYRGMGLDDDFHNGAKLAALTVEELLGINIHSYVTITFDGFVEMIDLIGGVTVEVAPEFAERQGETLPTGRQHLYGEQALIYARHRQNPRIPEPGSTSQDGDRVRRNQNLMAAIFEQGKKLDSQEILAIVEELDENLYTSLQDWDILELVNVMYNHDPETLNTVVLPGEGDELYQEHVNRNIYYYFLDFEETDRILQELDLK